MLKDSHSQMILQASQLDCNLTCLHGSVGRLHWPSNWTSKASRCIVFDGLPARYFDCYRSSHIASATCAFALRRAAKNHVLEVFALPLAGWRITAREISRKACATRFPTIALLPRLDSFQFSLENLAPLSWTIITERGQSDSIGSVRCYSLKREVEEDRGSRLEWIHLRAKNKRDWQKNAVPGTEVPGSRGFNRGLTSLWWKRVSRDG